MATIIIDVICEKQTTEVTTIKPKNPRAPKETSKIKGEATKRGRGKAKPLVQKESGLAVGHKSGRRREKEGRKEGTPYCLALNASYQTAGKSLKKTWEEGLMLRISFQSSLD